MSHRHLALLRAINTGKRRVTNDQLVAAFANLGFGGARAYQASGNVLFDGADRDPVALRDLLEAGLVGELGFDVPAIVRTAAEIHGVADDVPFSAAELASLPGGKMQVIFCDHEPEQTLVESFLDDGPDLLRVRGEQVYWLPEAGISTSTLRVGAMPAALGRVTVRTHGAVQRMAKLL
ncbi:MAG: DUF1697 domain-containing protein [Acidimicrobiales bacterium]